MKHGPFFYALYTGVACIIIMVLLQPFGIDRVEHYKYPIIVGYAVLSAITYLLASLLTTYALRMPRREEWDFKRNIAVGLLICPLWELSSVAILHGPTPETSGKAGFIPTDVSR